mgnify:CR=1 FL=1
MKNFPKIGLGANQTMYIVNPTATAYSNVNAANEDIPAYSMGLNGTGATVILSDAEQATFAAAHTSALMILSGADYATRRLASKILRLGKNPGSDTGV